METIKDLKNYYIDFVGIEYTNFVDDNYQNLLDNYNKMPIAKKKTIKFPIYCYCVFRNIFIEDINLKINEN